MLKKKRFFVCTKLCHVACSMDIILSKEPERSRLYVYGVTTEIIWLGVRFRGTVNVRVTVRLSVTHDTW